MSGCRCRAIRGPEVVVNVALFKSGCVEWDDRTAHAGGGCEGERGEQPTDLVAAQHTTGPEVGAADPYDFGHAPYDESTRPLASCSIASGSSMSCARVTVQLVTGLGVVPPDARGAGRGRARFGRWIAVCHPGSMARARRLRSRTSPPFVSCVGSASGFSASHRRSRSSCSWTSSAYSSFRCESSF